MGTGEDPTLGGTRSVGKVVQSYGDKRTMGKVMSGAKLGGESAFLRSGNVMFFNGDHVYLANVLDHRLSEMLNIPFEYTQLENYRFQIYSKGKHYSAHLDSGRVIERNGTKWVRFATYLQYLSSNERGGVTAFPRLGIEVVPTAGDAVLFVFRNSPSEDIDFDSYHRGSVTAGDKLAVQKCLYCPVDCWPPVSKRPQAFRMPL